MIPIPLKDWRQYLTEGNQYLKTAIHAAEKRPEVFTPDILYNLTAMAIEKYLMAYLMHNGDLADNHTMADLVRSVERHTVLQPEFAEKLLYLDSFQEICDIYTYCRKTPSSEDILRILAIGEDVRRFVASRLPGHAKVIPEGPCSTAVN